MALMSPDTRKPNSSEVPSSPRIERLRSVIRDGGPSLLAKRSRQVILRKLHEGLLERMLRHDEQQPTSGTQSLGNLTTVEGGNKLAGTFYDPTPRLIIRWILECVATDRSGWNFIDIGTGRGRVVMEAARHEFRRVIGVEFAEELFQAAEENVAAIPLGHIKANRVSVIHDDATTFKLPGGPSIFFLYNPFNATVLKRFLDHVLEDYARSPRPMMFLYLNPEWADVLENEPALTRSAIPNTLAPRLSLLSPYDLFIYETKPH